MSFSWFNMQVSVHTLKTFVHYTDIVSQLNITIIGFLLPIWKIFQHSRMMNCFREHFHKCSLCQKFDVVDHKYTQRSTCRSKVYRHIQIFLYTILFHYSLYLTAAFYHLLRSSLLTQYHFPKREQCCFL